MTPAGVLVAGYARARRTWGPGHVIHVDRRGYCYLNGPTDDRATAELVIDALPLRPVEAQQILDRLESEVALGRCLTEVERRSAVMATTRLASLGTVAP